MDPLPPGTEVSFTGLTNRTELNHTRGTVIAFRPETNRYVIEGAALSGPMLVKPNNLWLPPGLSDGGDSDQEASD